MAYVKLFILNSNKNYYNLLTTIKETSCDEKEIEFKKSKEIVISQEDKIIIYEGFFLAENLKKFIQNILENKFIVVDKIKIKYNTTRENNRTSFLTQREDCKSDYLNQICSPFYSNCTLIEYWDISLEIKNLWLQIEKSKRKELTEYIDINLNNLIDRVGNILHFKEIDEIDVKIQHQNDKFLTLSFIKKESHQDNEYIAIVEVYSYDDLITKQSYKLNSRFTDIPIQDNENSIHLEIYNLTKGTCVYSNNLCFWGSGHSSSHYFRRDIHQNITQLVEKDKKNLIYSLQYNRKKWTNNLKIKNGLHYFRSNNDKEEKAFDYFLKLLNKLQTDTELYNNPPDYIYLVDPYIFCSFPKERFIEIFNNTKSVELRIIGSRNSIPSFLYELKTDNQGKYTKIKIKNIKTLKRNNVGKIEYLLKEDGSYKTDKNGNKIPEEVAVCHDRWIATRNIEYGFTNSLNNFKSGVSFFESVERYFVEAESLWNTTVTQEVLIEELNFDEK